MEPRHKQLRKRTDLFAIVCDRLQDGSQRLEADRDIEQMSSIEEVVVVAKQREDEVTSDVQEGLQRNINSQLVTVATDFHIHRTRGEIVQRLVLRCDVTKVARHKPLSL
jgi:hypothetical protein